MYEGLKKGWKDSVDHRKRTGPCWLAKRRNTVENVVPLKAKGKAPRGGSELGFPTLISTHGQAILLQCPPYLFVKPDVCTENYYYAATLELDIFLLTR